MLAYPGEDWKSVAIPTQNQSSSISTASEPATPEPQTIETQSKHEGIIKIMPAAKILMTEYGINPQLIPTNRGFLSKRFETKNFNYY